MHLKKIPVLANFIDLSDITTIFMNVRQKMLPIVLQKIIDERKVAKQKWPLKKNQNK